MNDIGTILRDELSGLPADVPGSELLGFFDAMRRFKSEGKFVFACPRLLLARRILKLWRAWRGLNEGTFNAKIHDGGVDGVLKLDKKRGRVMFEVPEEIYEELVSAAGSPRRARKWSWLRGIWAVCASVYLPRRGYYVAICVRDNDELAAKLLKFLTEEGVMPSVRSRGGSAEYMLRSEEQIMTCLTRMGLMRTSLALEEIAIVRSLRSRANKLVNCDSANIGKSLAAAREQLELVRKIEFEGLWDQLPPAVAEIARARGDNPSASLAELGQALPKPVSKSTVEYRLRRLEKIVNDKS
ncbi:MAG: DNA-binding protein WhiA [Synergistaceae bacterium]|jgi:DNA-binding protein WhiA|nr:DNA-binding protein WhiA [Synergistaceae bacterium]